MAIDHIVLLVPEDKFKECLELYAKALEPLGYQIVHEFGEYTAGLGSKLDSKENFKAADFWAIGAKESVKAHIAFRASGKSLYRTDSYSPCY